LAGADALLPHMIANLLIADSRFVLNGGWFIA